MRIPYLCTCLILLLTALLRPAEAHNGAVAIAVPVEGIVVDGDLSDWPSEAQRYPLTHFIEEPGYSSRMSRRAGWWESLALPTSDADLSAQVMFAYSAAEAALFVGIDVRDDNASLTPFDVEGSPFRSVDGCMMFLVPLHDVQRFEYAGAYYTQGDRVVAYTPPFTGAATPTNAEDVGFAAVSTRQGLRFEWRIDLASATDGAMVTLSPDAVLGISVLVRDRDADGSYSVAALDGIREDVMRTTDLILAPPTRQAGALKGRSRWQDETPRGHRNVDIAAPGAPPTFTVHSDSTASGIVPGCPGSPNALHYRSQDLIAPVSKRRDRYSERPWPHLQIDPISSSF